MLTVEPHPLLDFQVLAVDWGRPLGEAASPSWLHELSAVEVDVGLPDYTDGVKKAVRDLLRHGGFKPAGRGKPCSEYIRGVAAKGRFPEINLAVDACNIACLHSGLPVSLVDVDLLVGALRVGIADPDTSYVFNASGQEIRVDGLLCLFDEVGPCANAVKDSQRTKTHAGTTRTLSLIWGISALAERTALSVRWYSELVERLGGRLTQFELV